MSNNTKQNSKEQKAEQSDSRSNVSAGNIPAIKKLETSPKNGLYNKQSIICQGESPHRKGIASKTAITSLTTT